MALVPIVTVPWNATFPSAAYESFEDAEAANIDYTRHINKFCCAIWIPKSHDNPDKEGVLYLVYDEGVDKADPPVTTLSLKLSRASQSNAITKRLCRAFDARQIEYFCLNVCGARTLWPLSHFRGTEVRGRDLRINSCHKFFGSSSDALDPERIRVAGQMNARWADYLEGKENNTNKTLELSGGTQVTNEWTKKRRQNAEDD